MPPSCRHVMEIQMVRASRVGAMRSDVATSLSETGPRSAKVHHTRSHPNGNRNTAMQQAPPTYCIIPSGRSGRRWGELCASCLLVASATTLCGGDDDENDVGDSVGQPLQARLPALANAMTPMACVDFSELECINSHKRLINSMPTIICATHCNVTSGNAAKGNHANNAHGMGY